MAKVCFFCLVPDETASFNEDGAGRSKKGGGGSLNILLNYLLNVKDPKYLKLVEDIQNILVDEGEELDVQICANCEKSVKEIGELDRELEVLQMKIIYNLKSFRERILQYFVGSRDSEEICRSLELLLLRNGGGDDERKGLKVEIKERERRMIDVISSFQMAVYEKGENVVEVPCVLLDKYSLTRHKRSRENLEELQGNLDIAPSIVKTEAWDLVGGDDFLEHFDDDSISHDNYDHSSAEYSTMQLSNDEDTRQNIPVLKLKRKAIQAKPISIKSEEKRTTSKKSKERRQIAGPLSSKRSHLSRTAKLFPVICKTELADHQEIKVKSKSKKFRKKPGRKPNPNKGPRKKENFKNRSIHRCELCPSFSNRQSFIYEHHLRSHESPQQDANSTDPEFKCDQCSKQFFRKQYYDFHMRGHQGKHKIVCDHCNFRVPYSNIKAHVRTHTDKIFECPNCSYCGTKRETYLIHLRSHGSGCLECDICSKPFRTKGKLLEHLHEVHKVINKYICEVEGCDKEFYDIAHLRIHRKAHTKPQECSECGKVFSDATKLKIHFRAHTKERTFKCPDCSESFTGHTSLSSHRIAVHGQAKFKCKYCEKEYLTHATLMVHLTIHEGTGIPCGKCDKVFGNKSQLRRHQVVHAEKNEWICEECGKGFNSKFGLARHSKMHGGEKKFKCQYCGKAFMFRKYLEDHERTHTGERPFTCSLCGKGFTQRGSLSMHNKKCNSTNDTDDEMKPTVSSSAVTQEILQDVSMAIMH